MELALPLVATPYRAIDSTVRDANGQILFIASREIADAIVAQCNGAVPERIMRVA